MCEVVQKLLYREILVLVILVQAYVCYLFFNLHVNLLIHSLFSLCANSGSEVFNPRAISKRHDI